VYSKHQQQHSASAAAAAVALDSSSHILNNELIKTPLQAVTALLRCEQIIMMMMMMMMTMMMHSVWLTKLTAKLTYLSSCLLGDATCTAIAGLSSYCTAQLHGPRYRPSWSGV